MTTKCSLPIEQYQVGVVCALRHEMTAAIATLDERHQPITDQDKLDPNNYVLGRVHEHNVVIACLPAGVYGTLLKWWRARQQKVAAAPVAIKRVPAE